MRDTLFVPRTQENRRKIRQSLIQFQLNNRFKLRNSIKSLQKIGNNLTSNFSHSKVKHFAPENHIPQRHYVPLVRDSKSRRILHQQPMAQKQKIKKTQNTEDTEEDYEFEWDTVKILIIIGALLFLYGMLWQ